MPPKLTILPQLKIMAGTSLSFPQAYLIIHNFCVTIVACALDLTFQFNWVSKDGTDQI